MGSAGGFRDAWAAGPEVDAWLVMVPSFVIGGVGSMLIGTTTSAAAFRDVDDDRLGRASGSYYVTRRLGSAAGAVAAVAILGDAAGVSAVDRFRLIWGFSAVCFAFAAAVMRFFYPRPSMRATSR